MMIIATAAIALRAFVFPVRSISSEPKYTAARSIATKMKQERPDEKYMNRTLHISSTSH